MRRIYLAGPCTGIPDYNYPAFHAEAARLRALGYHVENPAAECGTWEAYLRIALRQMLTCEVVALLPGWIDSRGATLKRYTAQQVGIAIVNASAIQEALQCQAA